MTQILLFFSSTPDDTMPVLGNYLGQLTDELSCKNIGCKEDNCTGHWIEEFISCGPKNYAYKLNTGEMTCKVRGFSLNFSGSKVINFDSMKEILDSWINKDELKLKTIKTEICRNKHECTVYSKTVEKPYGVVYDKRIVQPNYQTIPFGFIS